MSTWATAVSDLRVMLSDGPTDKLRAQQQVFGVQDSTNKLFKTFDFRRVTDFSSTATSAPFGVYLNSVLQATSAIAYDDLGTGFFGLSTAPSDSVKIYVTCYIQWFLDTELQTFLTLASNWLDLGDDFSQVPSGLKTAALKYAMHEAYQKLAVKYAENTQGTYRLQDAPDEKRLEIIKAWQGAGDSALKEAYKARDDYYGRKGKALAPLSATARGNVRQPTRS